jgi:hypothetical protein
MCVFPTSELKNNHFLSPIARVVLHTCTECSARTSIFYGKIYSKLNLIVRISRYKCLGRFSPAYRLSSLKVYYVSRQAEFTLLLLPLLSRKIKNTIPALLPHPSLLAHAIYQALAFDAALIEEGFTISATSASKIWRPGDLTRDGKDEWNGISELILGNKEWFETWINGEKKC